MELMTTSKRLTFTAICMTLCVVLPQLFHAIPNAGSIFLPLHIPVLLCGMLCGPTYGLICGLVGPMLSSVLTGMPGAAYLPGMMMECGVYGLVFGLLLKFVRTGRLHRDLYIGLVGAMLAGRVVGGLASAFLFAPGEMSLSVWVSSYFVTAVPGIVIQLVLLPAVCVALMKAGLVPNRYPERNAA